MPILVNLTFLVFFSSLFVTLSKISWLVGHAKVPPIVFWTFKAYYAKWNGENAPERKGFQGISWQLVTPLMSVEVEVRNEWSVGTVGIQVL